MVKYGQVDTCGQGELWSGSNCVQEASAIRVNYGQGQVIVLLSGLLYTCGQEQSSVVKVGNVR